MWAWDGLPLLVSGGRGRGVRARTNGQCGYYIGGVTLPILPTKDSPGLAAFPAQAVTLYQEGSVQIAAKAAFTLASGSTLIMSGDPRKMDTRYLDLSVNGTLVVQPGAALRVGGGSIRVAGSGASLQMQGTQAHPIIQTRAGRLARVVPHVSAPATRSACAWIIRMSGDW